MFTQSVGYLMQVNQQFFNIKMHFYSPEYPHGYDGGNNPNEEKSYKDRKSR